MKKKKNTIKLQKNPREFRETQLLQEPDPTIDSIFAISTIVSWTANSTMIDDKKMKIDKQYG